MSFVAIIRHRGQPKGYSPSDQDLTTRTKKVVDRIWTSSLLPVPNTRVLNTKIKFSPFILPFPFFFYFIFVFFLPSFSFSAMWIQPLTISCYSSCFLSPISRPLYLLCLSLDHSFYTWYLLGLGSAISSIGMQEGPLYWLLLVPWIYVCLCVQDCELSEGREHFLTFHIP
jgi:hypothetical protein